MAVKARQRLDSELQGMGPLAGILASVEGEVEQDAVRVLRRKYLGEVDLGSYCAETGAEIRQEACDLLVAMARGQNLPQLTRGVTSRSAFAIANLMHTLSARGSLDGIGREPDEIIMTLTHASPTAPCATTSRYWFLEALLSQGILPSNTVDRRCKSSMSIPSTRDVLAMIEEFTGITAERIRSSERSKMVVDARFRAIYIMRKVCLLSLTQIGSNLGGRDHTTVLNGLAQVTKRMNEDHGRRVGMAALCDLADTMGVQRHLDFLRQQPIN